MIDLALYYTRKGVESAASRLLAPYYRRRFEFARSARAEPRYELVDDALESAGVAVESYKVDAARFREFVAEANYPKLAYVANREEKFLEHFVSIDLLDLPPSASATTLVDVASCRSFFPQIMRRRGYRVIAQDLSYPPGLHGDRLGGDAAAMDVAPGSIGGMTLHCSFEHFEGDADTRFALNTARVLAPGARAVILPLYLSDRYVVETDPLTSGGSVNPDEGAELVASFGYTNRFGRHYDAAALQRRVLVPAASAGLQARLIRIAGARDVNPACYLRYALILERPRT